MDYSEFAASPHALLLEYGLVETVKTAGLDTRPPLAQPAEDRMYADPTNRRFPIGDSYQTLASSVAYHALGAKTPMHDRDSVATRLKQAAAYYGLTGKIAEAIAAKEAEHDRSFSDEYYGWVFDGPAGAVRRYPMRSSEEVTKAASYFGKHRQAFSYDVRRVFADRLLKRAEEFGVTDLPHVDELRKTAGHGIGLAAEIADTVQLRAAALKRLGRPESTEVESLQKIANSFRDNPRQASDAAFLAKVASVLARVDAQVGALREYSDENPMPEDVLFRFTAETVKQARAAVVTFSNGSSYEAETLRAVPTQLWRDAGLPAFDGPLADPDGTLKTAAEASRTTADRLDFLLSNHGVQPLESHQVRRPDLKALAAEYRR